eukprot:scaffold90294_cov18-Prasinocladus_malaysianus.AAC.1
MVDGKDYCPCADTLDTVTDDPQACYLKSQHLSACDIDIVVGLFHGGHHQHATSKHNIRVAS